MVATATDLEAVKQFAAQTTRAVLVTRRRDGGLQSSPMAVVADDDGNMLTATRARNAKTYNLARDPRAMLCLFTEQFPGPWLHVEGTAEIERLPEAMPLLADYYRRRGQDTTTQAFRERMLSENRVLIRVRTQRVVRSPTARSDTPVTPVAVPSPELWFSAPLPTARSDTLGTPVAGPSLEVSTAAPLPIP